MLGIRRISTSRWWHKKKSWLLFAIFLFLVFVTDTVGPILLKIVAILASNSFGLNGLDK